MKRTILFVVLALLALVSCVPTSVKKGTQIDASVIQSISTLRNRGEIIVTWGISEEVSDYTTWIEFSKENVSGYVISARQQHDETVFVSEGKALFSALFSLGDVASYSREGERETYTLLLRIVIQAGGGSPVYSELHHVTFFTITTEESEK